MAILARRPPVVAAALLSPLVLAALLSFAGYRGALVAGVLMVGCFSASIFLLCYRDPTTLVGCFIAFTVLIPSDYTVGPLGAAGSPATVVGIAAFVWWLFSHLGSSEAMAGGRQPIRIGIFIFGASILLSYGAAFSRVIPPLEISGANRGLLELFGLAGIALLLSDGIPDRDRLDVLGRRLVFWVSVLGVLGMFQYLTKTTFVSFYTRVPGFNCRRQSAMLGTRGGFVRVQANCCQPDRVRVGDDRRPSAGGALCALRGERPEASRKLARGGANGRPRFRCRALERASSDSRLRSSCSSSDGTCAATRRVAVMVGFLGLLLRRACRVCWAPRRRSSPTPRPTRTSPTAKQDLARSGFLLTNRSGSGEDSDTFIPRSSPRLASRSRRWTTSISGASSRRALSVFWP